MVRSTLVAFCVLASAATVHAECAWVLWVDTFTMRGGNPVDRFIEPSDAYTSKAECDSTLQQFVKREEARRKVDSSKDKYYTCFPDTMDPRGPKGK
jgi:hypothetical protein